MKRRIFFAFACGLLLLLFAVYTLEGRLNALDSEMRVESIPEVGVTWPTVQLYSVENNSVLDRVENITIRGNIWKGGGYNHIRECL